jgi:molybdate transport system substrate-binding protein
VRPAFLAALGVALLVAPPAGSRSEPMRLTVFAAASLTEVFPRIDRSPTYSFGGSNQLAFQIRQGAPADVFASASPDFTQTLFRDGLVERPRAFASNNLVLAVPRSNPAGLRSVFDLTRKEVKLVIGSASSPIGRYTRRVLRTLRMTSVLEQVVSQEPDVRGILGKVALGQADAGFVYRTDVRAASRRVVAIPIPARAQPNVRYEVAVVKTSRKKAAARAWVRSLLSAPRARRLLVQAGFALP